MPVKSKKITIESARKQIEYLENVIAILEKCSPNENDSLETKIFKLYANLQNVTLIEKELKNCKINNPETQKPFISKEITNLIKSSHIEDKEIEDFVKKLQSNNLKFVTKKFL